MIGLIIQQVKAASVHWVAPLHLEPSKVRVSTVLNLKSANRSSCQSWMLFFSRNPVKVHHLRELLLAISVGYKKPFTGGSQE